MTTDNKPLVQFGWLRVLLYVMLSLAIITAVQLLFAVIRAASGKQPDNDESLPGFLMNYLVVAVVMTGIGFLFRRLIDRQSIRSMGFQWRGYRGQAASGFFLGTLLLATGSMILVMTGHLFFTSASWQPQEQLLSFLLFIIVAFTEEIAFRGYMLNNLMQSSGKWVALLISASIFALFHSLNAHITLLAILNIFVAGILLGVNYLFTRNLWFSVFLHFSWNYFQGPVFGFEVSGVPISGLMQQSQKGPDILTGGAFGFEGSVICLGLTTIASVLLASYYAGYRKSKAPEKNLVA
ncbi:MAG TPA: type II CAAX endopeptidase family protein [Chitinophagaceae bacterium]